MYNDFDSSGNGNSNDSEYLIPFKFPSIAVCCISFSFGRLLLQLAAARKFNVLAVLVLRFKSFAFHFEWPWFSEVLNEMVQGHVLLFFPAVLFFQPCLSGVPVRYFGTLKSRLSWFSCASHFFLWDLIFGAAPTLWFAVFWYLFNDKNGPEWLWDNFEQLRTHLWSLQVQHQADGADLYPTPGVQGENGLSSATVRATL